MVWSSWSSLLERLVTLISESNLVHGISVNIEMRLWKGFENWKYLFLDNWEYASSTMVVKCAKCIEFIFLCSTKTSSNKYAILPLDQDTLMWISMIFMQMTPAYNDCTVDTLHKSVSVRQLSAEPKPLLPSKEPGICHRFNCYCCWERGGGYPLRSDFPKS